MSTPALFASVLVPMLFGPPASGPPQSVAEPPAEAPKKARILEAPKIPAIGPVQPWVSLSSWSEYNRENYDGIADNENFVSLVNRLSLGLDARLPKGVRMRNSVRVDTQNLFFPFGHVCDSDGDGELSEMELGLCRFKDDYRLERVTVAITSKYVDATAGDFNVQFGRGVALSVRNVDQLGVDATIKGGRLDVHAGPIKATGVAGYANRANSDFATRQLVEDPGYPAECDVSERPPIGNPGWTICSDLIGGGRLEAALPGKVKLGAHYAYIDFGEQIAQGVGESLHLAGGDIARARIAKVWNLFAGGTALIRVRNAPGLELPSIEGVDYTGYATYLSNTFVFGSTTAVLEAKHNVDYLVAVQPSRLQYTSVPTLEREDQQVPNNFNATGARLRVDHTWRPLGLTLFANAMGYSFSEAIKDDQFAKKTGLGATHFFVGAMWRPKRGGTVQASTGYRYEWHAEDGRFRRQFPHLEFYVNQPVGQTRGLTHAISFRIEGRFEDKQVTGFDNERFFFGSGILGYSLAPYLQLSFIQGVSTEFPALPSEVALTSDSCDAVAEAARRCKPHLWPGAEVRINIAGNNFIRVFGGRQVGGRICVNGSCRIVPDFEGVRGELVLSF